MFLYCNKIKLLYFPLTLTGTNLNAYGNTFRNCTALLFGWAVHFNN